MYTYRSYFDNIAFKQFSFITTYNGLTEVDFLKKVAQVVRGVILTNSAGVDETVDFGGDISKGGYKFDPILVACPYNKFLYAIKMILLICVIGAIVGFIVFIIINTLLE